MKDNECPSELDLTLMYDGELPTPVKHLSDCSRCRRRWEGLRSLEQMILANPSDPTPVVKPRPRPDRTRRLVLAAATFLVLAGALLVPAQTTSVTTPPADKLYNFSAEGENYTIKVTGEAYLTSMQMGEVTAHYDNDEGAQR